MDAPATPPARPRATTGKRAAPGKRAAAKTAATASTVGLGTGERVDPSPADGPVGRPRGLWRNRALYSHPLRRVDERWSLPTRGLARLFRNPETVLALLGGPPVVERDGRVLNRGTQAMLALVARIGGSRNSYGEADPELMRRQLRRSSRIAMPVRTDIHVSGRRIPGPPWAPDLPIRIYRQFGTGIGGSARSRPPAIVYFHGGGWVNGDLDTHDAGCRMLAAASRCLVVSVAYRLAPEHPFPAAVDDALAAYAWVHRNTSGLGVADGQVGVMGDSAGGNLAAVVALLARRGHGANAGALPPATAQGLIYPVTDAHLDSDSIRSLGDDLFLTREALEHHRASYLPDQADWEDPRASPLLAVDVAGAPPALVVTAGFDPLRDDGAAYAARLAEAGVDVEYRCYDDQIHGFMGMGILADSLALATEVCDAMGRLMRRSAGTDTRA